MRNVWLWLAAWLVVMLLMALIELVSRRRRVEREKAQDRRWEAEAFAEAQRERRAWCERQRIERRMKEFRSNNNTDPVYDYNGWQKPSSND